MSNNKTEIAPFEIKGTKLYLNETELQIGNLEFIEEIGHGANAYVFCAQNTLLGRKEAVKIWKSSNFKNPSDNKERFLREVKKNANVPFDGIAKFYDAGVIGDIYYARLEYIKGITLEKYLQTNPEFSLRWSILKKILQCMLKVYDAGYYHGDLHSKNILIADDASHSPIIIDFGTSYFSGPQKSHRRDCTLIISLCYEVLPELNQLSFIDEDIQKILKGKKSSQVALLFLELINLLYDFQDHIGNPSDTYAKEEIALKILLLKDDFSFILPSKVDSFVINQFGFGLFNKLNSVT